jgi:voltage-gated potassium channel
MLFGGLVTVITGGYGDVYPITIEGRVTSALLMITGIAVLGVLISTLGAGLVESRLKKITIEDSRIIAIKERIDNLEEMDEEEIKSLNVSINSLHRDLIKGDSRIYNLFSAKCDHANLGGALYCNMCSHSLKAKNISSRQEIK